MFADVMEVKLRQWLIAVVAAIAYSGLAASCTPQPVPAMNARAAAVQEAADRSAALQRQVEHEAAQQEAAYSRMSDQERMRGIVYDPIQGYLKTKGQNHD